MENFLITVTKEQTNMLILDFGHLAMLANVQRNSILVDIGIHNLQLKTLLIKSKVITRFITTTRVSIE